ncbi:SRPBCC family protein [Aldersonia kunmingensis]|uniref:SRPBCC family protein n=1 Tax=Aldersonia kunmingensis TaxID=408066 RepID=UPI0008319D5B|nr:SRPBCC family protein [Aldersonia kunmingensis]
MPNVDVSTQIVIECPLAEVASYASDPDNAPKWYVNIDSVDWLTPRPAELGTRVAFRARFLGRTLEYTYEFLRYEPERLLEMRTAEGPFPMSTMYAWTAVDDTHTRMTLRNSGYPTGFGKLAAPVMAAAMRRANNKDLAKLKEILESS